MAVQGRTDPLLTVFCRMSCMHYAEDGTGPGTVPGPV